MMIGSVFWTWKSILEVSHPEKSDFVDVEDLKCKIIKYNFYFEIDFRESIFTYFVACGLINL